MVGACPYPVPQGSQVLFRETAAALRDAGHEVHLVTYGYGVGHDTSGLSLHRGPRIPGVRKTSAGPSLFKPILDIGLVYALRRLARRTGAHIIGAHNYEGLWVALRARIAPVVYHAHNAMADELPSYFHSQGWAHWLGQWMDRRWPRCADAIIAPHRSLGDYLMTVCGCDTGRTHIVPPPLAPFGYPEPEYEEAMPPVLYTGNLDSYQNIDLLTRAIKNLRKTLPATRFIVATSGTGCVEGAQMVQIHNPDALRDILTRDCVVACPRVSWSGYPIKLINAMYAGRPVVACASAACGIENETTGLVVDDNDESAFADALRRLLTDMRLRRKLGQAAASRAYAQHDPGRIGMVLSEIYRSVARRKDPPHQTEGSSAIDRKASRSSDTP